MTFRTGTTDAFPDSPVPTGTCEVADVARSVLRHSRSPGEVDDLTGDRPMLSSTAPLPARPFAASKALSELAPAVSAAGPPLLDRVSGMRKWAGRIVDATDSTVTAELIPFDGTGPTLLADFERSSLGIDDAASAAIGDVVYVTARTVRSAGHRPTITSAIRLRRLGVWTADEISTIRERAERQWRALQRYVD